MACERATACDAHRGRTMKIRTGGREVRVVGAAAILFAVVKNTYGAGQDLAARALQPLLVVPGSDLAEQDLEARQVAACRHNAAVVCALEICAVHESLAIHSKITIVCASQRHALRAKVLR